MAASDEEKYFLRWLREAPAAFEYRYTDEARSSLLRELFNSLGCRRREYMGYFFPNGLPSESAPDAWKLSSAQGAMEGAEYSPAARGKPCGHIFKSGEATYRCKTCSLDDTCVMCSKCFESSDHEDHTVYVSISPGNTGCCDCGDAEAWRIPVQCAIHTAASDGTAPMDTDGGSSQLPVDIVRSIRSTIARALDYACDVISCSPEQLRLLKSDTAIRKDEEQSRLTSRYYGPETHSDDVEFALILWNDEKHTVTEVEEQVRRACKKSLEFGKQRAHETNSMGRSIVIFSKDITELLNVSRIIEQIRVTVTIRSSRDTFREQMCGTIIEWLEDISGCSVGGDHNILRTTICEELLGVWRVGSKASNTEIGKHGIDDHSLQEERETVMFGVRSLVPQELIDIAETDDPEEMEIDHVDWHGDEDDGEDDNPNMVIHGTEDPFTIQRLFQAMEPDTPRLDGSNDRGLDTLEDPHIGAPRVPQTPHTPKGPKARKPAPAYWRERPAGHIRQQLPPHEDLRQRVRLDWLIMFDLRLWKKARIGLRDLYISTVVAIPQFKRILGLRFAGLYTALSQLYLIADREPDHSIINMSLQMLTTPSITSEVVRRGNFLTSLMAILYTFLTTRQVGHPYHVNPTAALAFDGGQTNPLTNRRMYHFFHDMRYLLGSDYVQERLRLEPRYTLQFLDLVRLHQGICPNVRAIVEHVEYEAEAWISASLVTREINKLSRQFSEAFRSEEIAIGDSLRRVISTTAKYTTVSSMGWERLRFKQAEMKEETVFKQISGFQFDTDQWGKPHSYKVVCFSVDKDSISFHHALHYCLSWLIEAGKNMSNEQLRRLLFLDWEQLKDQAPTKAVEHEPEDLAVSMFDLPLRVCVWLAQMKTGMWVRNGFSLRHQMQTYRAVSQRDLTHHRDIFLLQTSLVTINPSRMLVGMIDRFNLNQWMEGNYAAPAGYDEVQILDLAEDFLHLLIVILSDRLPLIPLQEEPDLQILKIRRELVHILCFKPMQFSDLARYMPERLQDNERFQEVLSEIANYRAPDGLSDYGTFDLKDQYLDEVDPYIVQFSKNQREEIEVKYRARIAKKTGKEESEVVFEPRLRPIETGAFVGLASFTRTPIFAQIIYYSLAYALQFKTFTPNIPETRVETFLQLSLHLCQLAVHEDNSVEGEESNDSFILHALEKQASDGPGLLSAMPIEVDGGDNGHKTVATVLYHLANLDDFKACWAKINHILRSFKQKKPSAFGTIATWATGMGEKVDLEEKNSKEAEAQKKKQMAKERQAKIMAQIKQQQQTFMDSAGMDFEDDFSDVDSDHTLPTEEKRLWKYPAGTCILCQEEMNESRLYGTLAFVTETSILRQTDPTDPDYMYEVVKTPESLDRSANDIRPFGVASMNRKVHRRLAADGSEVVVERQGLGRGFSKEMAERGPIVTGCSHLMHFSCFEHYYESTRRRHPYQIARNHPESLEKKEFVCPLCKALGNAFLPIIWKSKEESLATVLQPEGSFTEWLRGLGPTIGRLEKAVDGIDARISKSQGMFFDYGCTHIVAPISSKLQQQFSTSENIQDLRSRPSADPLAAQQLVSRSSNQFEELQKTYLRLRDTFRENKIPSELKSISPSEFTECDSLVRTLGFSISAIEIAQRGVASEIGSTLLDRISPQIVTHLRILSETISSYVAIGALRVPVAMRQFKQMERDQLQRLFTGPHHLFEDHVRLDMAAQTKPLLSSDPFLFSAECSLCVVPGFGWDIHHIIRLCYIAEIVKAIIVFGKYCGLPDILHAWEGAERLADIEGHIGYTELQLNSLHQFTKFIKQSFQVPGGLSEYSNFSLAVFRHLIGAYATPFLRKSIILLHVRFGMLFPPSGFAEADEPEQVRLSKMLQLPSVDEIFEICLSNNEEGEYLREVISGWCKHLSHRNTTTVMSHPAIFELVGLPRTFDVLVEEAMKRRCPTTGNEITDPTVCLFCGDIFCSQALCCLEKISMDEGGTRSIGGCNKHLRKCGKNVGLFINIRKCALLHLHEHNGSWAEAPYLDAHGETDIGLRRNRQLFLNQRRYDALVRSVWLQHGIPSVISRKMEAELNTGGWDTL